MKRIRKKLDITQKELAELIQCSKSTVERWEMSDAPITGPVAFLLKLLEKHPEYIEEIRVPEKVCPVRLWYMHNQDVCTLIEVDESSRQVHIKNYTDKLMFRAFGVNEKPGRECALYADGEVWVFVWNVVRNVKGAVAPRGETYPFYRSIKSSMVQPNTFARL